MLKNNVGEIGDSRGNIRSEMSIIPIIRVAETVSFDWIITPRYLEEAAGLWRVRLMEHVMAERSGESRREKDGNNRREKGQK